ncbi:MAG: DUF302 domain-containing protein [Caulobacteraceae bacterium]
MKMISITVISIVTILIVGATLTSRAPAKVEKNVDAPSASSARDANPKTPSPTAVQSSHTIRVEHVRLVSGRRFAEVRQRLEEAVPILDPKIADELRNGDKQRVTALQTKGPKLSIFLVRDHGSLLQLFGGKREALQYEIGNPVTASTMVRYQRPAALYAPLRVVLFADEQGRGVFEYDRPSSFLGQFGDPRVAKVGRDLDTELNDVLRRAAK